MKLLTHKEYESLSPVKRSVYEKRVKKYYGARQLALATELWPGNSSAVMMYDPFTGHRFITTKDFLDANETAVIILAEDERLTFDEAMMRLQREIGL